jgi:hypothetical protein
LPDRCYIYHPTKNEDDKILNRVSFFIIRDTTSFDIDKNNLDKYIDKDHELQLVYNIINNCEYAFKAFKYIWESIQEGNPENGILKIEDVKVTPEIIDQLNLRWHKAVEIKKHISEIEKSVTSLNKEFNSPLIIKRITQNNISTMGKYNYSADMKKHITIIKRTGK